MDPYKELGVKKKATAAEIKKAYRKKARQTHPDHGGNVEDFHKVQSSYLILSNPKSREKYDETGEIDEDEAIISMHDFIFGVFNELLESMYSQTHGVIKIALTVDIIKGLKKIMRDMQSAMQEESNTLENKAKYYKAIANRLSKKSKGPNLFSEMLMDKHNRAVKQVDHIKTKKAEIDRALVIVDDYIFEPLPAETPVGFPDDNNVDSMASFMEAMFKMREQRRRNQGGSDGA